MQINTFSAQVVSRVKTSSLVSRRNICMLRLFVDWLVATNRGATTLLHKHWIPSVKILCPWTLEAFNVFGRWTHKIFYLSRCSKYFPKRGKINFFSVLQKSSSNFSGECIINILKGNLQNKKRHHVAKFQSKAPLLSIKQTVWKQRKDILAFKRSAQLMKNNRLPVSNHLFWQGAVSFRCCFCVGSEKKLYLTKVCSHYPISS